MKYFLFKRESDDFTDILSDENIINEVKTKIKFLNHIILGIPDEGDDKNSIDKIT